VHSPDKFSSSDDARKPARFKWPTRRFRAAEFSYVMRQMRPALLLSLLVIGALLGLGVWQLYLVKFEAKTSVGCPVILPRSVKLSRFSAQPSYSNDMAQSTTFRMTLTSKRSGNKCFGI